MEMRHYNTWLFSEEAARCLHQITSDKAIIDRKRGEFAQNFQFPFDITFYHFDFIMSDSTDSELEIVNPSPVRAHTNSSVAQKTKEKKRDHWSSIDAETCAKQPKNADFYAEKANYFANFVLFEWIIPCIGDTHKKQKGRAAQTGQYLDRYFDEECGLHPARKFI